MRLSRSLLAIAAAATLAATTAFAEDSRAIDAMEGEAPVLLSEEQGYLTQEDQLALEEGDVIYIYPMEVTEYYLIVPDEMQING
jgi:hypothetical protein